MRKRLPEDDFALEDKALFPLQRTVVVDLTTTISGGLCTKFLSDSGASVTRVQLQDRVESAPGLSNDWRQFLDRGKEMVNLEVERDSDRLAIDELLSTADLLITSYRHSQLSAFELDCKSVLGRHRELTVACITSFGQTGPYSDYVSSETAIAALSGLSDATPGFPDKRAHESDPPLQSLAPLAEVAGAFNGACIVTAALLSTRQGHGRPRHIEVSSHEAAVSMMTFEWGLTAYGGTICGRRPRPADVEPNYYTRCKDGDVIVAAFTDHHWQSFLDLMENPSWATSPKFADAESRTENWRELHAHVDTWASEHAGIEILHKAQERGLPFCPAFELATVIESEHVRELNAVEEDEAGVFAADPIVINGTRRLQKARDAVVGSARRSQTGGASSAEHASASENGVPGLPLAGIRVVDLTQYVAGPFAAQTLASLGAEVILVESASHLVARRIPPFAGEPTHDASMNFNYVNRGKKSVLLNLRTEEGRSLLNELVASSDVVLENFSRRAVERLGLTWETLSSRHPHIVVGSISGFGRTGPWGGFVALHSGVILLSGLASVTRDETGRPRLVGSIYPDLLTGACLAAGVEQALLARLQTGKGAHVEVSMLDVVLTAMGGLVPGAARGEPLNGKTAVFLSTNEENRFLAIAADDYLRAGGSAIADEVRAISRADAMQLFQSQGLEAASVLDIGEVMVDAHLSNRGFLDVDEHPVARGKPAPGVAWTIDGQRPRLRHAPLLGADTNPVLTDLGRPPEELAELVARGVLS